MIFEICAVLSVIIFAILAFFAVRTLRALESNLKNIDCITQDVSIKMSLLDSTFKSISAIGDMGEMKLNSLQDREIKFKDLSNLDNDYSDDLVEIVIASIRLGTKLFRR
ncbi:MAG: hypothetical protein H0W50_02820 [Parachlamydiaceae bacterium]|nr:hypothetical protein [Parachlamydiaceae bacterium]